ncbi:hypothetical protein [Chryseobacterium taiwanense]|uniref:hypothetical protein n=1 Tax=Chryseobacterium taiwanense TaxID=363331 RepID=UPI000AEF47F0|nr:hypothetical protein [Chryseobacterium taiwanense]
MKDMLKRIFLVIFVLLVLTAISGFFFMQKHPLGGQQPVTKSLTPSGQTVK